MLAACRILVAASLLATIASTLSVYPHSLAYFNELAGGPENGHKHLLGSNLDWGQDLLLLKRWSKNHPLAKPLKVAPYGLLEVESLGFESSAHRSMRSVAVKQVGSRGVYPRSQWYAYGINNLMRSGAAGRQQLRDERVAIVGYSIYVYYDFPDSAQPSDANSAGKGSREADHSRR